MIAHTFLHVFVTVDIHEIYSFAFRHVKEIIQIQGTLVWNTTQFSTQLAMCNLD